MALLDVSSVRGFFETARNISIFLPQKPGFDHVAAGLGLKLSLDNAGKSPRIICPDEMVVEFNRLVGVETVLPFFGSRNLIISFPGQTEHVDKISYNLEKGELQLVVTPKPEAPDLDHKKLKFITAVQKPDLLITIGIADLRELGSVYDQAKEHFDQTNIISISHQPHSRQYTLYQLHDYDATGLSEIVTHIIDLLGLSFDIDSATNLLVGLEKSSANFSSLKVSVTTFEAAAKLMRKGAKRHADEISASDFPAGSIPTAETSEPIEFAPDEIPVEQQITASTAPTVSKSNGKKSAPADWYEPKIYKGPMQP